MSERWETFTAPAAVVAIAIMVVVSVLATFGTHPIATVAVVLIGVALVMITIDTGGHSMVIFSGAFLLMASALAIARMSVGGVVPWAIAGVVVLAFSDAVRLSFAERRSAMIEPAVVRSVVTGLVIVAAGSVGAGFAIGELATVGSNANWLLVPLALLLAVGGAVGLAVTAGRSPGPFDKRRWRPGERLASPPRNASDDPSFKTSVPPPPR